MNEIKVLLKYNVNMYKSLLMDLCRFIYKAVTMNASSLHYITTSLVAMAIIVVVLFVGLYYIHIF